MEVHGGREWSTSARAERRLEEGTGEEEQGTWASRCFNFWVLARKGQLRAALNEAGSHPINCLVRWRSCSLDGAAQKNAHLTPPTPTQKHTHTPSPPHLLEQEVMDHTFEKFYGSIEQSRFMLCLAPLTSKPCRCVYVHLNVCPCLLCTRLSVVTMHIFREVASFVPPALKPRPANWTLLMRTATLKYQATEIDLTTVCRSCFPTLSLVGWKQVFKA